MILVSLMHRRIPSWWRVAGESGTKLLYEPEKPVVYIVPITSILGRLPLIPAGDHGTIPAELRGRKKDLFPLGKCVLCTNSMHTLCRLCEACDLGGADPAQSLLHSSCSLLTTTCGKPAHIVWGPQDNFCNRRFWGRWCT